MLLLLQHVPCMYCTNAIPSRNPSYEVRRTLILGGEVLPRRGLLKTVGPAGPPKTGVRRIADADILTKVVPGERRNLLCGILFR